MQAWERELSRAWKLASSHGVDASLFARRAKDISNDHPEGTPSSIFGSGCTSQFSKSSLPTEVQVLRFYNKIIKKQTGVLKDKVADAASISMNDRSQDYYMLLGCLSYFANKRFQAFVSIVPGTYIKWTILQKLRIENLTRMLDETTWAFIGYYSGIVHLAQKDWTNIFFYLVRSVFTCVPRKYQSSVRYGCTSTRDGKFDRSAYNHFIGDWSHLSAIVEGLNESPRIAQFGPCLEEICLGSAADAIRAAQRFGDILPVTGLGDFNMQEILWHAILLREQFAAANIIKRPMILHVRKTVFAQCRWGPGALLGTEPALIMVRKSWQVDLLKRLESETKHEEWGVQRKQTFLEEYAQQAADKVGRAVRCITACAFYAVRWSAVLAIFFPTGGTKEEPLDIVANLLASYIYLRENAWRKRDILSLLCMPTELERLAGRRNLVAEFLSGWDVVSMKQSISDLQSHTVLSEHDPW